MFFPCMYGPVLPNPRQSEIGYGVAFAAFTYCD